MDSGIFVASTENEYLFSVESVSTKEISFETIVWDDMTNKEKPLEPEKDRFNPDVKLSETFILAGSAYQSSISNNNQLKYKLNSHIKESAIINEKFVIVDEDDTKAVLSIPNFEDEMSQAVAINRLSDYGRANPHDKRNLKVVSSSDLVEVVT